ncbi:uncharacterized protein [Mytilus edulis]|uniref:uncharacterized protein n=1 Tax=Mytilus edulis TaxID=6550 RepID=UPI0039EED874
MMSIRNILCLLNIICHVTLLLALKVKPGSIKPDIGLPTGLIKLHPPGNVTTGYVGTFNIYIYWYEPENYHLKIPFFMDPSSVDPIDRPKPTSGNQLSTHSNPDNTYHVVTGKTEAGTSTEEKMNVTTWFGHELVPFHKAHLIEYMVKWKKNGTETNTTIVNLSKNETEYHIKDLQPETTYQISVTAYYKSVTFMKSEDIFVTTLATLNTTSTSIPDEGCYCDPYGAKENGKKCHRVKMYPKLLIPQCDCKQGHSGLFCENCAHTYFRTQRRHPCYPCPCNRSVSTGLCDFDEDKLQCIGCKEGYGGRRCEKCVDGYFRLSSDEHCRKCLCYGRSKHCDRAGHCTFCEDNTTGYSCERCQDDYIGDPMHNRPCIHKDKIKATSAHTGGIVAGVCIGLLILIGVVVGYILYRKCNSLPNGNKFWTVELKDDHERVNFSALPEDEIQARRMDYDFYQDQGGNRGRDGSQKYSHLQEV